MFCIRGLPLIKTPHKTQLRAAKALIILALSGLSYDYGLPAVGDPPVAPKMMKSSYVLYLLEVIIR